MLRDSDIYICIGCGLEDKKVECSGIYYCPNPFCSASGSTYWKTKNLNIVHERDGVILTNYDGWLEKGMKVINEMPYELGSKIMVLKKTKKMIGMLKRYEKEKCIDGESVKK